MKLLLSVVLTMVMAITSPTLWASTPDKELYSESAAQHQKLDLNSASAEALQTLPGIGEKKAAAIVAYRNSHGGFSSIEQLKDVKGIGDATLENIKSLLTLSQ
ncbi:Endonuclease/exonuclease/phosphatase family domain-containing protein [Saliniradius amylolyticus]|uniref:Endonuclease/exonuclease/phosphatase family domain-containing protein n=1 Tax=Saliniradius amylolyticus TaxID=2183582 RepID=A0A2S2E4C7_9ALTE|nr:helix-hairpin-helix domain-containing protein [Saliniradius amylolyticus]AWL12508.1 Endonuclease/exonuclease/phosphatase family domain-containing protein [Saliniradius amylolyticus]